MQAVLMANMVIHVIVQIVVTPDMLALPRVELIARLVLACRVVQSCAPYPNRSQCLHVRACSKHVSLFFPMHWPNTQVSVGALFEIIDENDLFVSDRLLESNTNNQSRFVYDLDVDCVIRKRNPKVVSA